MYQIIIVALLALMLGANTVCAVDAIEAVTKDGKKVVLKPDGTWSYAETKKPVESQGEGLTKPQSATQKFESKRGFVEVWYDPKKWKATQPTNPAHEFTLLHSSGDAQAILVVERLTMPIETLKNVIISNAKKVAPDPTITWEKELTVNGVKLSALKLNATSQGVPFTFYCYYWSGKAGCVQYIALCGQNLFDEFANDFTELLNGLVITKP